MPFDGKDDTNLRTDVIARLELLGELAAKSQGDQSNYRTCLLGEVARDPRLNFAALGYFAEGIGVHSLLPLARWFGFRDEGEIFGSAPLSVKREIIAGRLAELRLERTTNTKRNRARKIIAGWLARARSQP